MLALNIARRDRTYAVLMLAAVLVTATAALPLIYGRSGLSALSQRRRDIPDLNSLPLVFQPALTRAAEPSGFTAYSAAGTLLFRPSSVVLRLRDTTACSGREQAKGC